MQFSRTQIWPLAVIVGVICLMLPERSFSTSSWNTAVASDPHPSPTLVFVQVPQAESSPASITTWTVPTSATASALTSAGDAASYLGVLTLPSDLAEMPDEKPPGAKVPEPASLMLVGTGLLALARASRLNRPRWKFASTATPPISCAVSR